MAAQLTEAELRVALAVGRGATSREAAEALYISTKTVNYHVQNIYRKLGLNKRESENTTLGISFIGLAHGPEAPGQ